MCDVSGEVSIFVAFLSVSNVNTPLGWTGELIKVDGFLWLSMITMSVKSHIAQEE